MPFVIPTIFTAVDRMSATMVRMEGAMAHFAYKAEASGIAATTAFQATNTAAKNVAINAGLLGTAIVIPFALATKAAMDFEKQMANVATLMDSSAEDVTAFSDAVLALAQKTPVPIHDLTESLYQIRSEGFKGAQAIDILGSSARLAVAGLSTATEAAKSMATAIRVFGDEGLTTNQIADVFFKTVSTGRTTMAQINESFGANAAIVHEAGVRFAEFQAATATLTNAGLTASEAQTAIKGSTIALLKPTGEMTKAFHMLGVATGQELIKKMGGLVPAMDAVGKAAQRAGLNVNKEFGRVQGLVAYTLLTGTLRSKFDEDIAYMTNGVDKLSEAYRKQLGTTASQAQLAKNNLVTLGIRIGELLLPSLTALVKTITPVIEGLTNFARQHTILSGIVIKGIAIFGGLSLAVSGVSFAMYGITKAMMAFKTVQAFATVLTGNLTGGLLAEANAARGATMAIRMLNAGISSMGVVGILATAIAGLTIVLADDYKAIYEQTEGMRQFKNGMLQSVEPINKATLALREYNKAKSDYNELVQFKQVQEYQHGKGFLPGLWFDIVNAFKHPVLTGESSSPAKVFEPNVKDFPALDTSQVQRQYIEGDTTRQSVSMADHKPKFNLYVNVDGNGKVTASAESNNGPIPVELQQTGMVATGRRYNA